MFKILHTWQIFDLSELLKDSLQETSEELKSIMTTAWLENQIPITWTKIIHVSIATKLNPASVHEYGKITLVSIRYKIYARHLLQILDDTTNPIYYYQADFYEHTINRWSHFLWYRNIRRKTEKREAHACNTDRLGKAFDSVVLIAI